MIARVPIASMRWIVGALVSSLACLLPLSATTAEVERGSERLDMVATIERHARLSTDILGPEGILEDVLDVISRVERHRFVPERRSDSAYEDRPLKIGFGQTISQPFIVALMTHLLQPEAQDTVLEIGTGSGYQAAVLSPLVEAVCTIEIIPELGQRAARVLKEQGYDNVRAKIADGYHGWPDCGPFDGIIVTAAADHVPPPLVAQLKPGGRMVIPVGGSFSVQYLTLVEKSADGHVRSRQLLPVRFVPFRRAGG